MTKVPSYTEDYKVVATIHRADVAELICKCLLSDASNNKVLSAVDPGMMYGQTKFEEFSVT